jgi:DNA-binding response OmpR family regulator
MTDTVLVLSTNERNLELLADLVEAVGCDVQTTRTVEEFDAVLASHDPTISVLDTEGLSANVWKRCDYLREQGVSVVILTASTPAHLRREAISRGVQSILEKPVDRADLQATVRGLLQTT